MQAAKSSAARRSVTFTLRQGRFASRNTNRVRGPVALVFAVVALKLTRLGRDRLAHLADELDRALVEADHRPLWVGRLGVEIEHVLHAGDVIGVDLGNAPHLLAPRLEIVLGQAVAHRFARQALVRGQLDHRVRQELQRPARAARRRARTGGRHQQCLLLAGELALGARARLPAQRPPQVTFDEPPLGPIHGRAADPDTGGDFLVAEPSSAATRIWARLSLRTACLPPLKSDPSSWRSYWVNMTR